MKCPKCQYGNLEDAIFCNKCGEKIDIACSKCGKINPSGSVFCNKCGQPLKETTQKASEPPTQPPLLPTSFADDRFQIKESIGEGARKKVYLAYDNLLDREVAIKTEGLDEGARARMIREYQATGRLGSLRNIVTVYDVDEPDGQPSISPDNVVAMAEAATA